MMTNEQLDALAALEQAATAGPWREDKTVALGAYGVCHYDAASDTMNFVCSVLGSDSPSIETIARRNADAAFISAARNAFRDLVAQAREANELRAKNDPCCNGCGEPLLVENAWMTDGCPCNSPLGCNNQNETRWRLLMQLQQRQHHETERLKAELAEAKENNRCVGMACEFCDDPATKIEYFDRPVFVCDTCHAA